MSDTLHPAFESWFQSRCPDVPVAGARAVLLLAARGSTPPFIARYRKECTGNLDETAVRRSLEAKDLFDKVLSRQSIIVESIDRHATLTPELREKILAAFELERLEDLYHPYRQQKKNRALAAREAGLQQLADWIWNCGHGEETPQEGQTLELWAFTFRNEEKGIADAKAAIEGARDILVERLAGDTDLRTLVRRTYFEKGFVRATKTENAKPHSKFEAYFAFQEKVALLREPANSHRYLALRRGQSEGELQLAVGGAPEDTELEAGLVAAFEERACSVPDSPGAEVLRHAGRIAFKNHVRTSIENEVHGALKEAADAAASAAFAADVGRLLLEAPFGPKPVLGLDPGVRTGCKLVAIAGTGALTGNETVFPHDDAQKTAAVEAILRLAREAGALAVAVGNGTGGREVEVFARAALREAGIEVPVVLVNEAGASVYGTSEMARAEFPELDATVRGAISIARRLQDPLAELVKIDARSIGVGQYQHDVPGAVLQRALDAVIASCVHCVGVNLNTASPQLLARVAGIGPSLAAAIVQHRGSHGPFRSRQQLLEVPGFGPQAFEQAAGFLRVPGGENPLDDTGVHPERYAALEALAARLGKGVGDLLGPGARQVREAVELKEVMGAFTWEDVGAELEAAGRDPRGAFVPFVFREDVRKIEDLKPGMACPGIVNNVTAFGAFVDVGVHQDGLVHDSQIGKTFVKELREVVRPGDRVEVRVLKVDLDKKQISLSMRPRPEPPARRPGRAPAAISRPAGEKAIRTARARKKPSEERQVAARPSGPRRPAPRPERPRPKPTVGETPAESRRPAPKPIERRPEPRRQAFNNPFAVLAGLKVPEKPDKG